MVATLHFLEARVINRDNQCGDLVTASKNSPDTAKRLFQVPEKHSTQVEYDQNINGNIIYSTLKGIYTLKREDNSQLLTSQVVVKPLHHVTGFAQLNSVQLVIVENRAHCIKSYNRQTNILKTLAGTCGSSGYFNSIFTKAIFSSPLHIHSIDKSRLLVTDYYNRALRMLDTISNNVSTFAHIRSDFPRAVTVDNNNQQVFVATTTELLKINLKDKQLTVLSWHHSNRLNSYSHSSIFWKPTSIVRVSDSQLIVADDNNQFKSLNLNKNTFSHMKAKAKVSTMTLLSECKGLLIGESSGTLSYLPFSGMQTFIPT